MKLFRPIWILFFSLASIIAGAQYPLSNPVIIDEEKGLPGPYVSCIVKDSRGYMWFGTFNGLCRFDGSTFKVFKPEEGNPNSIDDTWITTIMADGDLLWIGHKKGISIFNISTETFRNYHFFENEKSFPEEPSYPVSSLFKDKAGYIWMAVNFKGIGRFDPKTEELKIFQHQTRPEDMNVVNANRANDAITVMQDVRHDSIVWASTVVGLLKLNKATGKVERFFQNFADKDFEVNFNSIRFLHQESDGMIYFATWHLGINRFDPHTNQFSRLPLQGNTYPEIYNRGVTAIRSKPDDRLWVTTANGLLEYDIKEERFIAGLKNDEESGLKFGITFIDESGRIWFASDPGVYVYDPLMQQFNYSRYRKVPNTIKSIPRQILEDEKTGNLMLACQYCDGLMHLDRTSNEWSIIPPPRGFFDEKIYFDGWDMVWLDSQSLLMLEGNRGLYSYQQGKPDLERFPIQPKVVYHNFRPMTRDKNGDVWIGAVRDGLYRINLKTGQTKHYMSELTPEGYNLPAVAIWYLHVDSFNNIWIRRDKGYSVYLSEKDTFLNFLYPLNPEKNPSHIENFALDKNGRMWMAGGNSFLHYADTRNPEKGIIKKMEILHNNEMTRVGFISSDKDGNIWAATGAGLYKLNADDLSLQHFGKNYGLKPILSFIKSLSTGEMIVGHRDGISFFHPDRLQTNPELPQPYITSFKVFDKPLVTDTSLLVRKAIRLSYKQNFFSIEYSAIGYSQSDKITFQYMLEGFDEQWVDAGDRRYVAYTNVPGGNYTFRLRALNSEGMESDREFNVEVSISTPWWKTLWFLTTMVLLLISIGYSLYRYRINQVRQQEKIRNEFERRLADVEMNALRAQMNPHFIFNCLNSIDYYIIKNETRKASEYLNRFSRLIRLILQNSRANSVSLRDELEALKLYIEMESLRFNHRFNYEVVVEKGLNLDEIEIPPMLIQPYVENSIWHGLMHKKGDGKLSIALSRDNGYLQCIVEDNGIGRDRAEELKANRTRRKKSVGMQITNDRISMINKLYGSNNSVEVIDLKDETGQATGTRIILNIPL
jgi:ligand-binding sensor domain-containing protein/anti-sigma regulatory factor (Ser/Thr protein kinase)